MKTTQSQSLDEFSLPELVTEVATRIVKTNGLDFVPREVLSDLISGLMRYCLKNSVEVQFL